MAIECEHFNETVVSGAKVKCSKSTTPEAPFIFNATSQKVKTIKEKRVAISIDFLLVKNVPIFGVCSITNQPCNFASGKWKKTSLKNSVSGHPTLTGKCTMTCLPNGGTISFIDSGQIGTNKETDATPTKAQRIQERLKTVAQATQKAGVITKNFGILDKMGLSKAKGELAEIKKAGSDLIQNNKAVEYARLANDVYNRDKNPRPCPPEGWKQLTDEELKNKGLDPKLLTNDKGFKAAIFQSTTSNDIVVAFAGTEEGAIDWLANGTQGLGLDLSGQYNSANKLAKLAKNIFGDQVSFTGHSLGGGLASWASLSTNNTPTNTFNAAGLNALTALKEWRFWRTATNIGNGFIKAFRTSDDELTWLQEGGVIGKLAPNAIGDQIKIKHMGKWLRMGHSQDNMVTDLEAHKDKDLDTINNFLLKK